MIFNGPWATGDYSKALGADKLGIAPEALSGKLAELLPQAIDHATPNGTVPEPSSLQQGLGSLLKGFLGR